MSVILKGNNRSWDKRLKIDTDENAPTLNPKDPIQAAVMGSTIRAVHSGDFEKVANLQQVGRAFAVAGTEEQAKVVVGRETITTLTKNGKEVETNDANTLKIWLDQGFEVVESKTVDILG
tara:strand:+ start:946 stop:1305 length:360 start_codon:yes stop_codon:yes gene_type:complete